MRRFRVRFDQVNVGMYSKPRTNKRFLRYPKKRAITLSLGINQGNVEIWPHWMYKPTVFWDFCGSVKEIAFESRNIPLWKKGCILILKMQRHIQNDAQMNGFQNIRKTCSNIIPRLWPEDSKIWPRCLFATKIFPYLCTYFFPIFVSVVHAWTHEEEPRWTHDTRKENCFEQTLVMTRWKMRTKDEL